MYIRGYMFLLLTCVKDMSRLTDTSLETHGRCYEFRFLIYFLVI